MSRWFSRKVEAEVTVYLVTNTVNGKQYVGKTIWPINTRWNCHVSSAKVHDTCLYRAIRKYGRDSFSLSVLEEVSSEEELNEAEKRWIVELTTRVPNGYNRRRRRSIGLEAN